MLEKFGAHSDFFFDKCKSVGDDVYELRFHFGSGFRVYYGEVNNQISYFYAVVINHHNKRC